MTANEPGYNQTTRPVKPSYFQQKDILHNLLGRVENELLTTSEEAVNALDFEVLEKGGDVCLRIWRDDLIDVRVFVTDGWTVNSEEYDVRIWDAKLNICELELGITDDTMLFLFSSKLLQNAYDWQQNADEWAINAVRTVETYMGKAWLQFHLSKAKGGCITINYPNQASLNNDIPTDFLSLTDPKTPARVAWIDIKPIEV